MYGDYKNVYALTHVCICTHRCTQTLVIPQPAERAIVTPLLGASHQTSVRESLTGYGPNCLHHPQWPPRAIQGCSSVRLQAPQDEKY